MYIERATEMSVISILIYLFIYLIKKLKYLRRNNKDLHTQMLQKAWTRNARLRWM